jgi:hypothetical protein
MSVIYTRSSTCLAWERWETQNTAPNGGELTAKAVLEKLKAAKLIKHSRALHCKYAVVDVTLGTRKVRLFFCKRTKAEKWKFLVTTNLKLDFMNAYRIYAMGY